MVEIDKKLEEELKLLKNHGPKKEKHSDYYNCNDEDFFYFYQESNGLNIFLNPINYKYMLKQYGDGLALPKKIEVNLCFTYN